MRHYLLVDDNAAFAENMAEIIRDTGADVTVAASGSEALELVRGTRFDALVTDMRMPVMGGARVVHEMRAIDPGLPAIVVTAYTGDDDLANARHEGLLAILPKPVPVARLIHLLMGARRNGLVAIVEDDLAMSDNLSENLRDRGFSAVTAASVFETDRLGAVSPFAALVDLKIPGGSTGEGMRRLAAKYPGIPLIVITAYEQEQPPLRPSGTFYKPFDTAKLLEALERLHSLPRAA